MLEAPEEVAPADLGVDALFAAEEEVVLGLDGFAAVLADAVIARGYGDDGDGEKRDAQHQQPRHGTPISNLRERHGGDDGQILTHDSGGVAGAHHGVDILHDAERGARGGLRHEAGDEAGEEPGGDAQHGEDAHGDDHAGPDLGDVFKLRREPPEEHGLADLDKGGESQHGGDERDDRHEEEADIARLRGLLIRGLVDHPL